MSFLDTLCCLEKKLKYNFLVKHQRRVFRKASPSSVFAASDLLAVFTGHGQDSILGHICSIKGQVLMGIFIAVLSETNTISTVKNKYQML